MSIRSVIARPTPDGYAGRYVHSDGHPTTRIPILLAAVQGHFGGDPQAAARFYLDEHPAGWYELGLDFTTTPGYTETRPHPAGAWPNRCFCHGDRADAPELLTHENVDAVWHEWIYLLRPDGLQIIRTDWRKSTQADWASHLLPWTTNPHAPLPATLR
ncbi:hypothetical protein [Kitasatospora azatica]|uniref:hypothetical protein n=1 Tax=Kitasatospora azatica TaxID=58347 RepID=UPI00068B7EF3|nr:hypothetical protein [Kitasatospora azatica]